MLFYLFRILLVAERPSFERSYDDIGGPILVNGSFDGQRLNGRRNDYDEARWHETHAVRVIEIGKAHLQPRLSNAGNVA